MSGRLEGHIVPKAGRAHSPEGLEGHIKTEGQKGHKFFSVIS